MTIDQATAQQLASMIPGATLQRRTSEWLGPFAQPEEYDIVLPSGARIDAGGLQYSIQSSPDVSPQSVVQSMAITSLYEQGASYGEASALAQQDVYGGVLPWVVPSGTETYEGVPVLTYEQVVTTTAYQPSSVTYTEPVTTTYQPTVQSTVQPTTRQPSGGVSDTTDARRQMSTRELILQMASEYGFVTSATPDEWSWFYREVTGSDAPPPESLGYTRASDLSLPAVSFDDWWNRLQRFLSGQSPTVSGPGTPGVTPGVTPEVPEVPRGIDLQNLPFFIWLRNNQTTVILLLGAVLVVWLLTRGK